MQKSIYYAKKSLKIPLRDQNFMTVLRRLTLQLRRSLMLVIRMVGTGKWLARCLGLCITGLRLVLLTLREAGVCACGQ